MKTVQCYTLELVAVIFVLTMVIIWRVLNESHLIFLKSCDKNISHQAYTYKIVQLQGHLYPEKNGNDREAVPRSKLMLTGS